MFERWHRQNFQASVNKFGHSVGVKLQEILFSPSALNRQYVGSFPGGFAVWGRNCWSCDGHTGFLAMRPARDSGIMVQEECVE